MATARGPRTRGTTGATGDYDFQPLLSPDGTPNDVSMDIRLQRALAERQSGVRRGASSSTSAEEIAVVAKVTDASAWSDLSEVRLAMAIGSAEPDGTTIVTGRIPLNRISNVRSQTFVVSMKAAQRVRPRLAAGVLETEAAPANFTTVPSRGRGGKGAIVGIVDFGCDFAHRNFQTSAGKTRVVKLWDQAAPGGGGAGLPAYGAVHSMAAINAALKTANPYGTLGYRPGGEAHGTHVMDIATGNGKGTNAPGMAPQASILFVEIAASDIPWSGPDVVRSSFGDSVQLLEALTWIFDEAGTKPCVINVSLGTNGGPHDGSTLVEQGIDRLLRQQPNRAIVIAASNSFADGIHAQGTVGKSAPYSLSWSIALGDRTENELELWYPGAHRLQVEMISPTGQSVGTIAPGNSGTITRNGRTVLFAASRLADPNNGDNTIGVFIAPSLAAGRWTVKLTSLDNTDVPFHAWIERDDGGQSTFLAPARIDTHTLGSISCSQEAIVVGSYDAHKAAKPLSWFSSSGPTRDARQKPEISAPGHDVVAASSETTTGVTSMSGTSMASPMVTGAVALLLAAAKARGRSLTIAEIRAAVVTSGRTGPPAAAGFDVRYGNGRLSAKQLLAAAGML